MEINELDLSNDHYYVCEDIHEATIIIKIQGGIEGTKEEADKVLKKFIELIKKDPKGK